MNLLQEIPEGKRAPLEGQYQSRGPGLCELQSSKSKVSMRAGIKCLKKKDRQYWLEETELDSCLPEKEWA